MPTDGPTANPDPDTSRRSEDVSESPAEGERALAKRDILAGLGLLLAALIVTGVTYALAAPGGTYYVASGAFIYGAISIRQGVDRQAALAKEIPYRPRSKVPLILFLLLLGTVIALAV